MVNKMNEDAAKHGLLVNDRIVKVNGEVVPCVLPFDSKGIRGWAQADMRSALQASPPKLVLTVERQANVDEGWM